MYKKALFFDYDGTIISDVSGNIPKDVMEMFEILKQKGYALFLNTGRTKAILDQRVYDFPFDGMLLGCGSYIEYEKEVLYSIHVEKQQYLHVKEIMKEYEVDAFFEGTKALYLTHGIQAPRLLRLLDLYQDANVCIRSVDELNDDFVKMFGCLRNLRKEAAFRMEVEPMFEYIDRGQHSVELILKGHSKATGIAFMMDKLGLQKEDCYVFGDSNNDLPMFQYIKNSALIGNENKALYDAVAYVSKGVDEGGLREALQHFQLL